MSQASSAGSGSTGNPRWRAQRPISEPVLESVEQELWEQTEGSQQSATQPPAPAAGHTGNGLDPAGSAWWSRVQSQVSQQVSQRPAQSALLALGVGAALTWLISQGLRRRRH